MRAKQNLQQSIEPRKRNHTAVFWGNRRMGYLQALKNNPEGAPRELKISANRLTRFGQIALQEALDMVRIRIGFFRAGFRVPCASQHTSNPDDLHWRCLTAEPIKLAA